MIDIMQENRKISIKIENNDIKVKEFFFFRKLAVESVPYFLGFRC